LKLVEVEVIRELGERFVCCDVSSWIWVRVFQLRLRRKVLVAVQHIHLVVAIQKVMKMKRRCGCSSRCRHLREGLGCNLRCGPFIIFHQKCHLGPQPNKPVRFPLTRADCGRRGRRGLGGKQFSPACYPGDAPTVVVDGSGGYYMSVWIWRREGPREKVGKGVGMREDGGGMYRCSKGL